MKKNYNVKAIFFILALVMSYALQGQVIFTSIPDSTAVLNELYSYDVEVVATPNPATFSLQEKPTGMTINASSGIISWTPTTIYQGGRVMVKATNSAGSYYQTFYVYVTDAVACPSRINSYWNFDYKAGSVIPDMAGSNDAEFVGIASNEPKLVNGMVGKAASFEPQTKSSTFYEVADQNQYEWLYDSAFTISVWFKNRPSVLDPKTSETLIGRAPSLGNPASWALQWVESNGWVGIYMMSGNGEDTIAWRNATVADSSWHHAAVSFWGSQLGQSVIKVWIDGYALTTFKDFGVTRFDNITPVTLGYWAAYSDETMPFSGYMDEVAIFDRGLNNAEITQLYNKGIAGQAICQDGNFTPVITSTPVTSVTEDIAYSYTLTARDAEHDALTKSAIVKPKWLSFNTSTGLLSGTPLNANTGDTTVTLRVSDGKVSVDQTFTLTVVNVNDPPQITTTPTTQVNEDVAYTYTFAATDIDKGDAVTLSAPQLPSWMSFNSSTGLLSGTPTNNQVGTDPSRDYNITLRATDNLGLYVDQSYALTVHNINDAPVINSQNSLSTNEDVALEITLSALNVTDVDDVYPDNFLLTVKNGSNYTHAGNTITPALNWNGTLTVPVDLSDGEATIAYDLSVIVTAVNDTPTISSTPVESIIVGQQYQYWITTSDVEGQALTITCPVKPSWLTFSQNAGSGLLQGTPAKADIGNANVTLQVTDGVASSQQIFTIVVYTDNYAPEITSEPVTTVDVDVLYTYTITATDGDGDNLTFSAPVLPAWLLFNPTTRVLSGIPAQANKGQHNVTLRVTDGKEPVEQAFVITVNGPSAIDIKNIDVARVYPVPASDYIIFEFAANLDKATLEIFSIKGDLITKLDISGQRSLKLDIADFRPNHYLYRISLPKGQQNGTFIVE
jgi:hypothetical protein